MKYQIQSTGFPIGQYLIPVRAVIDDVAGTDDWSMLVRKQGAPPPPNARMLSDAEYTALYQAQIAVSPPPPAVPQMAPRG
jgi:hypothetical protein